jgi:hypothetical protein
MDNEDINDRLTQINQRLDRMTKDIDTRLTEWAGHSVKMAESLTRISATLISIHDDTDKRVQACQGRFNQIESKFSGTGMGPGLEGRMLVSETVAEQLKNTITEHIKRVANDTRMTRAARYAIMGSIISGIVVGGILLTFGYVIGADKATTTTYEHSIGAPE